MQQAGLAGPFTSVEHGHSLAREQTIVQSAAIEKVGIEEGNGFFRAMNGPSHILRAQNAPRRIHMLMSHGRGLPLLLGVACNFGRKYFPKVVATVDAPWTRA